MTDTLTYAIGDVHGCAGPLRALLFACRRHCGARRFKAVFMGDYVDRGPDSRGVVDLLMHLEQDPTADVVCLKGNHEDMLLAACEGGRDELMWWWLQGGAETLRSYGVDHPSALPPAHLRWFAGRPLLHDDGRRLFVHAGLRPGVPLAAQTPHDLLWIREPFLSADCDVGRLVVHGHTPTDGAPDLHRHRLGIDTGAGAGGPLTAAVFRADQTEPIDFLSVPGA